MQATKLNCSTSSVIFAVILIVTISLLQQKPIDAYLVIPPEAHPLLSKFSKAQAGLSLNICLDVVGVDSTNHRQHQLSSPLPRVGIKNINVELHNVDDLKKSNHNDLIAMPGVNGMHPQLSSGAKQLNINQSGSYIDMNGRHDIVFDTSTRTPCWEMIWRENAEAGSIVCGLQLLEDIYINRNSKNDNKDNIIHIPKGNLYMNFPVWTRDGLDLFYEYQKESSKHVRYRSQKYMQTKREELNKVKQTNNPFLKAYHYSNAVIANEKISNINGVDIIQDILFSNVPKEKDLLQINSNLLLNTKGTVSWMSNTNNKSFTSRSSSTSNSDILRNQITLGTAMVVPNRI